MFQQINGKKLFKRKKAVEVVESSKTTKGKVFLTSY